MSDSEPDEDAVNLFTEPDGFFEPEKEPTTVNHTLRDGQILTLRLVGHNPLWVSAAMLQDEQALSYAQGHFLWNAGRTIADYLEDNAATLLHGRTVLELGAGAGLPSLVSAVRGARSVVVTDYPDADLIENLSYNIEHCSLIPSTSKIVAKGYLWGAGTADVAAAVDGEGFDVLILADLLFNHSEHAKLVSSIQLNLKKTADAQALVFFTPYRPWLLEKDLAFFDLAKTAGFAVENILEHVMDKVMFDTDPGDELLRRTVYGYRLIWAQP